jgi:mRNA interferase RelE/StbE
MSRYAVFVTAGALQEIKKLPGNVRQRVRRAVAAFAEEPRPAGSKKLETPELSRDVYRLRIEKWRVVYAVNDAENIVDVLAVRKRPPYDYGDLSELVEPNT